jgi:hypothetical protein
MENFNEDLVAELEQEFDNYMDDLAGDVDYAEGDMTFEDILEPEADWGFRDED